MTPHATLQVLLHSDATRPSGAGPYLLAHLLADNLLWGLGFTQALEARWPSLGPLMAQRRSEASKTAGRGYVLWSGVAPGLTVAHLVAERSRGPESARVDVDALALCLDQLAFRARAQGAVVHAPPLGTGLAAARWSAVEALLHEHLVRQGVSIVIHCLGGNPPG